MASLFGRALSAVCQVDAMGAPERQHGSGDGRRRSPTPAGAAPGGRSRSAVGRSVEDLKKGEPAARVPKPSRGTVRAVPHAEGGGFKKTAVAAGPRPAGRGQAAPEMARPSGKHQAQAPGLPHSDPIHQTRAQTNSAPLAPDAASGRAARPPFLAAARHDRIKAPRLPNDPINGQKLQACHRAIPNPHPPVRQGRPPRPRLSSHNGTEIRRAIQHPKRTAPLPNAPHGPDLTPIKQACCKAQPLPPPSAGAIHQAHLTLPRRHPQTVPSQAMRRMSPKPRLELHTKSQHSRNRRAGL